MHMKLTYADLAKTHGDFDCPADRVSVEPGGNIYCARCGLSLIWTTTWVEECPPPVYYLGEALPESVAVLVREYGINDPEVQGAIAQWEEGNDV